MSNQKSQNDALLALESSLKHELHPVAPNQDFIGSLRDRLEKYPEYKDNRRLAASLFAVALGLLSGLIIFLIGRQFLQDD